VAGVVSEVAGPAAPKLRPRLRARKRAKGDWRRLVAAGDTGDWVSDVTAASSVGVAIGMVWDFEVGLFLCANAAVAASVTLLGRYSGIVGTLFGVSGYWLIKLCRLEASRLLDRCRHLANGDLLLLLAAS
jgi:hypothetical protein